MKLDPKTFNPSIHKVTLKGKPVELTGFGVGRFEGYTYYYVPGCTGYSAALEDFEVTLVNLPIDTKVLVSNNKEEWYPRHFSHFDEDADIWVWDEGKTSFTSIATSVWNYWKFPDKL